MKYWILIIVILIAGCNTKYPLYFDSDLIEIPEVEGTWGNEGMKAGTTVIRHKTNEYKFYSSDSANNKEYMIAKFLRLDGVLFMDLQYGGMIYKHVASHSPELMSLLDQHVIAKINLTDSTLNMAVMNSEDLIQLAQEKKVKIKYEIENVADDSLYIITEKTAKLQELVKKYCNNQKVFADKDMVTLKKIR